MDGQDANRGWQDEKRESLLRDSPFRVVMRFALHLLAALLTLTIRIGSEFRYPIRPTANGTSNQSTVIILCQIVGA